MKEVNEPMKGRALVDDPAALRPGYHDDGSMPRETFDAMRLERIASKLNEANGFLLGTTAAINLSSTRPSS